MTTSIARRQTGRVVSVTTSCAAVMRRVLEQHRGRSWPAEVWQSDPVGFARNILGVDVWAKQIEILEAIRDNSRTAIAGGRKIGKDFALAIAALWWYASYPDARVFATATTAKQIDVILYREIRRLISRSGVCLACRRTDPGAPPPCSHSAILTGDVGELARTGIKSADFREIVGYTADKAEGLAGLSGSRILLIIDEASGYPDELHVALRGNLAASGCREVLISNPTRSTGFFFEAFHRTDSAYRTIQVSSRHTPNALEGRDVFPGLASREWILEQEAEWGKGSPLARVHIDGEFALNEEGALFDVHAIAAAAARWEETEPEGPLSIGIDPAGPGASGDEGGFAATRGKKAIAVLTRRGLMPDGYLVETLGLIAAHHERAHGRVRVVIDRGGEAGAKVWGVFISYLQTHEDAFDLIGLFASDRAKRAPQTYDRVRDELVANLADWMREGGAIPDDAKLSKELNAFRWLEAGGGAVHGRSKLVGKDKMREQLGRSPDRADALALSVWGPRHLGSTAVVDARTEGQPAPNPRESPSEEVFDPYRGSFDPYRGT